MKRQNLDEAQLLATIGMDAGRRSALVEVIVRQLVISVSLLFAQLKH
jgi:hypothetical protein